MSVRIVKAPHIHDDVSTLVDRITEYGIPADAERIYGGSRYGLFKIEGCCVKSFGLPNILNRFVYAWLRHGKARRSFDNARTLETLAISTPTPYGYSEIRRGLLFAESYYFCRHVDASDVRDWDNILNHNTLLEAFFDFTIKVFEAGVIHRDYSPGNILYETDGNGNIIFWLVDINRMRFGKPDRQTLVKMFTVLTIDPEQNRRLCRRFATYYGIDAEAFSEEVANNLHRYHVKKNRLHRIKHLIKK